MKCWFMLLALLLVPLALRAEDAAATPDEGKDTGKTKVKEIDWAGVQIGQNFAEVEKLAKTKSRKLVGPSRDVIDLAKGIFASGYRLGKDKSLSGMEGVKMQRIMVLNNKVVGVELGFSGKEAYATFQKKLVDAGYEKTGDGGYTGEIKLGEYQGKKVTVTLDYVDAAKASARRYLIQGLCLEVLTPAAGEPAGKGGAGKGGAGKGGGTGETDDTQKAVEKVL